MVFHAALAGKAQVAPVPAVLLYFILDFIIIKAQVRGEGVVCVIVDGVFFKVYPDILLIFDDRVLDHWSIV